MPFSDSNSVAIRYAIEGSWGATPATPATTQLRVTSESFSHTKETIVTDEIDSARQRTALLEVADSAGGGFGFELVYGEYEAFLASVMRTTLSSATVAVASATVAASSITGPTGTRVAISSKASCAACSWVPFRFSEICGRSSNVQRPWSSIC